MTAHVDKKRKQLYEKIIINEPKIGTPPVGNRQFLIEPATVEVIGVSFSGGQPIDGVEYGPSLMIKAGILDQLQDLGWVVKCPEKLPSYEHFKSSDEISDSKIKNASEVSQVTKSVFSDMKKVCRKGHFALTLGGDHSIALGTVAGSVSVYPDIGIIWVDAHGDINTPETSDSGNFHGMPISFLMGIATKDKEFDWLKPCLKKNRLVYIGLRDLDDGVFNIDCRRKEDNQRTQD
jgi:arginase